MVAAGEGDERVVQAGLLDPQVGGDDLVAGQHGDDGVEQVAGTGHHDLGAVPGHPRDLGQRGQQALVERRADGRNRIRCSAGRVTPGRQGCRCATTRPESITASRSHRRSASSMKWVTSTTVTPRSRIAFDQVPGVAPGLRVEAGGQLVEDGHLGLPTSASAIDSRCFWPPESLPNRVFALLGQARGSRASARQSAGSG